MRFIFIKTGAELFAPAGVPHYAGGTHGFVSAARALGGAGHEVHACCTASKAAVLAAAFQMGAVARLEYAAEGLVSWAGDDGLRHHVSFSDQGDSAGAALAAQVAGLCHEPSQQPRMPPHEQRLLQHAAHLAGRQQQQQQQQQQPGGGGVWVVLDADGSQQQLFQQAGARGGGGSLLEAAVAAFGRRTLLLVQNLHFLPLGPLGTQPREAGLLAAWAGLGGVVTVSGFVHSHLQQHGPPGVPLTAVPYSAWGAFGSGPFPDRGAAVAAALPAAGGQLDTPAGGAGPPVVVMLKLSPEKGAAVFFGLARQFPAWRFLAVCTDTGCLAAAEQLPNVQLLAPQPDVEPLLGRAWVLLAPSLWAEAFGMVVVEGMLRGIPALVSDVGGLPEAGLGAGVVLPVAAMQLPPDPATGCPSWPRRQLPSSQPLQPWAVALQGLLGSREAYQAASAAARGAALRFVQQGPDELQRFVRWLGSRCSEPAAEQLTG